MLIFPRHLRSYKKSFKLASGRESRVLDVDPDCGQQLCKIATWAPKPTIVVEIGEPALFTDGAFTIDAPAPVTLAPVVLQSVTVESGHNYDNNEQLCRQVKIPGAKELHVVFDSRCSTESGCDVLNIYGATKPQEYGQSSGRIARRHGDSTWSAAVVPGDSLWYTFRSDGSNTSWGYKFTVSGTPAEAPKLAAPTTATAGLTLAVADGTPVTFAVTCISTEGYESEPSAASEPIAPWSDAEHRIFRTASVATAPSVTKREDAVGGLAVSWEKAVAPSGDDAASYILRWQPPLPLAETSPPASFGDSYGDAYVEEQIAAGALTPISSKMGRYKIRVGTSVLWKSSASAGPHVNCWIASKMTRQCDASYNKYFELADGSESTQLDVRIDAGEEFCAIDDSWEPPLVPSGGILRTYSAETSMQFVFADADDVPISFSVTAVSKEGFEGIVSSASEPETPWSAKGIPAQVVGISAVKDWTGKLSYSWTVSTTENGNLAAKYIVQLDPPASGKVSIGEEVPHVLDDAYIQRQVEKGTLVRVSGEDERRAIAVGDVVLWKSEENSGPSCKTWIKSRVLERDSPQATAAFLELGDGSKSAALDVDPGCGEEFCKIIAWPPLPPQPPVSFINGRFEVSEGATSATFVVAAPHGGTDISATLIAVSAEGFESKASEPVLPGGGGASGGGGGGVGASSAAPAPPQTVASSEELEAFWATDMKMMTHIEVPHGATEIPEGALKGCTLVTSIVLPA